MKKKNTLSFLFCFAIYSNKSSCEECHTSPVDIGGLENSSSVGSHMKKAIREHLAQDNVLNNLSLKQPLKYPVDPSPNRWHRWKQAKWLHVWKPGFPLAFKTKADDVVRRRVLVVSVTFPWFVFTGTRDNIPLDVFSLLWPSFPTVYLTSRWGCYLHRNIKNIKHSCISHSSMFTFAFFLSWWVKLKWEWI